jgi:hypothetical protein
MSGSPLLGISLDPPSDIASSARQFVQRGLGEERSAGIQDVMKNAQCAHSSVNM